MQVSTMERLIKALTDLSWHVEHEVQDKMERLYMVDYNGNEYELYVDPGGFELAYFNGEQWSKYVHQLNTYEDVYTVLATW